MPKLSRRPLTATHFADLALQLPTSLCNSSAKKGFKFPILFPASEMIHQELESIYGVKRIGRSASVEEFYFAIGTEKKVVHPLVHLLLTKQQ